MAGLYPSINDRDYDLLKKMAWNWYEIVIAQGATDVTPPSWNDDRLTLFKKIAYYTAIAT